MATKNIPLPPLNGFAPVLSKDIHTLILGSFPSRESLAQRQYYAHPRNQFWRLLSAVLNDDLAGLPYEERLKRMLSHGIGLWDVITMCEREGSLDARIRKAVPNDFAKLKEDCPLLKKICFNGKVAGAYAPRLAGAGYTTIQLPSSSPAYAARTFEEKLAIWRNIVLQD
jgi:hypoxanthine-DNA glycosylase